MSKDKKKGRISRIRNNLKYENNDPLWKKLFYIKENLKFNQENSHFNLEKLFEILHK